MSHKGFRVSLHNHTEGSHRKYKYSRTCYKSTAEKLIKRALKKGIDGFAITDDAVDCVCRELFDLDGRFVDEGRRYKVQVLEGENIIEVVDGETGRKVLVFNGIESHNNDEGHALFIGHRIETGGKTLMQEFEDKNLEERLIIGRERRSIIIIPHPFFSRGIGGDKLREYSAKKYIDAVEGFSAVTRMSGEEEGMLGYALQVLGGLIPVYRDKWNNEADYTAFRLHLPSIATSDSTDGHIDRSYITLDRKPDNFESRDGIAYREFIRTEIKDEKFECKMRYANMITNIVWRYGMRGTILAKLGERVDVVPDTPFAIAKTIALNAERMISKN